MAKILLSELPQFAHHVRTRIPPGVRRRAFVIFLQGELGSGKTTFMQAFARELGIQETVQSPTYVLMKSYSITFLEFTRLVHIDAYRLEGGSEFKPLRPAEFLQDPHAIVCIEWPEKVEGALPQPDLVLQFLHQERDTTAREIEMLN